MSFLVELLGEKLISGSQTTCCATDELTNKTVALFFAASWCPRSQLLTRNLIKEYQRAKIKENNLPFEIIFISLDNDEESSEEFYRSMPWKAMPFSNDPQLQSLLERYDLKDIPSLIIFNMNGDMLTAEGVEEFELNPSFDLWINGKTLFWTQESHEGTEDIWTNVRCHSCHMKPIIGKRWTCIDRECELNLCSQCYRTDTHPHPLVELLSPQKNYSIKELFDGSTLIDANRHPVPFQSIENKYLGLYFSALWSEPDEGINENMVEIYTKINELNIPFDIIFISADENPTKFDEHFRSMTWKALSFDDRMAMLRLKVYFQVQDIPKMLVLKPDGQLLTKSGLQQIEQCGIEAIEMWCNNGVHSLSADYTWFSVVCDGCGREPLVGARYYCSTCENYDLCLKCQNQGHSHPLTLIEPPSK